LKKRGSQRENALSLLDVLDPHIAIEFKNLWSEFNPMKNLSTSFVAKSFWCILMGSILSFYLFTFFTKKDSFNKAWCMNGISLLNPITYKTG
jgi:hypothetical protein